jgi:DNA-directed RNA polymerase subunit H (RpoH/RPB5)
MAYKFKVGDRASYCGKEGVINQVHKGSKLTYEIKWDKGGTCWFQGRNLDKVVVKPKAANEFKVGDIVKLIANTSSSGNNVGDVGEVFDVTTGDGKQTGCRVRVPGGRDFALWSKCADLELVAKVKVEIVPKAANEFKVGDIVKLTRNRAGSCNQIGDVGEILEIDRNQCRVQVPGGDTTGNWSYEDDLELTTKIEKTMTLQEQIVKELDLEVGDVVKITHAVPTDNLGWKGGWSSGMNTAIGKEGTVTSISSTNVNIAVEGMITYAYPAQVLEFVSRGPNYKEMQLTRDYKAKVFADRIEIKDQIITIEDFRKLEKLVTVMSKK